MAESGCNSNNLQNNGNSRLGMSDSDFTAAVDNGSYSKARFISDSFGYGLVSGQLQDVNNSFTNTEKNSVAVL